MSESDKFYRVIAPVSGTFYRRPSPDEPPYVEEGDKIQRGQVVCIVESMKVFNEIRADRAGIVRTILVSDEDPVLLGQALVEVKIA